MTRDHARHGTTALFAALNLLDGQVIGQCQQRHTHVEWLKFLKQINRETPRKQRHHRQPAAPWRVHQCDGVGRRH